MLRPRPRPVKQQQEYIIQKTLLLQHACLLSKNNVTWYKNINKVMTSNVWHCFCSYCTKEQRCLLHLSVIMSHSVLLAHTVGSKTKIIRPRPIPRPKTDLVIIRPLSQTPRLPTKGVRTSWRPFRITLQNWWKILVASGIIYPMVNLEYFFRWQIKQNLN